MDLDEDRLSELIEESADTHADAMREAKPRLTEYVDQVVGSRERRRRVARAGVLAGVGGVGLLTASRAFAADSDVAVLQTAASIENLAVAAYTSALALPFIGGSSANATVKAFVTMTKSQHAEHAKAFNAAATNAGGKAQNSPDPKYLPVVQAAKLTDAAAVVGLAITLEDVAAQTYTADASTVSTSALRGLFVSVAAVEAQHRAILLAVQALLAGGASDLIMLGPPADKLPKAAGSVGFPDAFYSTKNASPASEGAVK